jgi:transposase
MGKPFSGDLRERIVGAVLAGGSRHEVARIFGVSASCVIRVRRPIRVKLHGKKREHRADWVCPGLTRG